MGGLNNQLLRVTLPKHRQLLRLYPIGPIARFVRRVTPDVNRARTNEVIA
jgi:hypothetical protein